MKARIGSRFALQHVGQQLFAIGIGDRRGEFRVQIATARLLTTVSWERASVHRTGNRRFVWAQMSASNSGAQVSAIGLGQFGQTAAKLDRRSGIGIGLGKFGEAADPVGHRFPIFGIQQFVEPQAVPRHEPSARAAADPIDP